MPRSEPIVGLPGFETIDVTGTVEVITTGRVVQEPACPSCKSEGPHRRKDLCRRRIRHTSIGARAHWLVIHVPKWRCGCGRYFRQRVPGVLPYQRATEPFKEEVVERHEHGHSLSRIRDSHRISWATTEALGPPALLAARWAPGRARGAPRCAGHRRALLHAQERLRHHVRQSRHAPCIRCPARSLELLRFSGFSTSKLPGKEHTEGRAHGPLGDLPRDRQAALPQREDRGRSVPRNSRLVGQCLMEAWKQLEPVGRKHRGLISLMRRRPDRLEAEQQLRLRAYFAEHPLVGAVYDQLTARDDAAAKQTPERARVPLARAALREGIVGELEEAPMPTLQ